ncbi:hypothetical protein F5J12DRAFT_919718 [Pisolithus orientalis]|uniref:uncharacterized protein n=1 Tax=Pisolithus orientalis TaxID=936130 RepID=UPI002224E4DE|nr:uncharacterized protein F5J12DRAFT_919718 [Pisolithus orientalis]KAI6019620.1 hypothetical protein F5J12DRAFT_919718 [Pisolithus orientalis]
MSTQTQQPAPLARTSSFFGAIRNIVTAPLQWLTGSEDFEDTRGKRRRLPVPSEQSRAEDDSLQSKKKRMRVTSPPRGTQAYLDPPPAAFRQPRRASEHFSSSSLRHLSASPRKSFRTPSVDPTSHLLEFTRTMSLDPPSNSSFYYRTQSVSSMQDIVEEHGVAKDSMSISRDLSMSPGRQLRVRSSLTPQPSGSDFGPVVPPPRERDPSQPPPLATLMSHPTFVKPPSNLQKPDAAETAKQLTLGSLVDAQRSARPVSRNSSILFGTSSATDDPLWPTNAAEKALHELEVYKTPLLPTRLRASGTIPDMFLPKKRHHITLMTDDREDKPRLGMKGKVKERGKKKDKETPNGSKPYAGEGGMKKWLARRRMEEEQAKEKEKTEAMLDEEAEEDQRRNAEGEKEKQRASELQVPPPPLPNSTVQPRAVFGREASSLRVGRPKTGRNHIERPMSRRMKKFSAAFEDEDEEMDDVRAAEHKMLEEAAKKAPAFEIPAGFTFAKEMTITHEATNAKEPPIGSLPYSLTKPPISAGSSPPSGEPVVKPEIVTEPSGLASTSVPAATLAPPILVSPPTPESGVAAPSIAAAVTPEPAPSGIPNFFANCSILSKPTSIATPPLPSFSVAASQTTQVNKTVSVGEQKVPVSEGPAATEQPVLAPSTPPSALPAPVSSASGGDSLFGAPSTSTAPQAVPLFTALPFGPPASSAPPKEPEAAAVASPKLAPSAFIFGSSVAAETAAGAPAAKPTAPFSFNSGPPGPKTTFPFGQPTSSTTPAELAKPQPAQPLFGGQSSRKDKAPLPGPFSFGSTPTQPATETKAAPALALGTIATASAPSAPSFTFGPSGGSNAADVSSKSFSFTPTTPVRPATPPKVEQEVNMDESPTREMNINGSGKVPERPTLNFSFPTPSTTGSALFAQSPATPAPTFSFGTSTVNPFAKDAKAADEKPKTSFGFGQTISTGFSQKAPESPVPSPSVAPTSPFGFGAPSSNPFSQASAAAPSAPATFTFGGSPATQPSSSPFVFGSGSQSASPANNNVNLPTSSAGSSFMFNPPSGATPAPNPFNTPSSAAPPCWRVGAPPPESGGRQIKKLPRRGGARR